MADGYTSISQAFRPADPTDTANDLTGMIANQQQVAQQRIALAQVARINTQQQLVRDAVKQHTVTDPSTGQVATDNKSVVRDLYLADPEAAEQYQSHVEDITAERAHKQQLAAQAADAQRAAHIKLVGDALAAVDERGDQEQAKADYGGAISSLKDAGIAVDPSDEVYSPGRVSYWKRRLVGPEKTFEAGSKQALEDDKQEAAAKLAEQKANATADLEKSKGANAARVAAIRNQGAVTAASIRAGATLGAANIRAKAGASGSGGGDEDDDTVDLLAEDYLKNHTLPALGQGQGAFRKQILTKAAKLAKERGMSAADITASGAASKADTQSLKRQTEQADNLQGNIKAMTDNLDNFVRLSNKIPNQSKYPLINSAKMLYKDKIAGDPAVREMMAAHGTALREYAKITSGNPTGAGVLSDSARHEALDTINGSAPMAQKKAAAELIKQDALNVVKAKRAQAGSVSARIAAPTGESFRTVTGPDGKQWRQFKNGKLVRAN